MKFEEDSIQDHVHLDNGHKHTDLGHDHSHQDFVIIESNYMIRQYSILHVYLLLLQQFHLDPSNPSKLIAYSDRSYKWDFKTLTRQCDKAAADISVETSGISGVNGATARIAAETKPKSYSVLYLMSVA